MSYHDKCLRDEEYADLIDPISLNIMRDPVIASDGKTYDCTSIKAWFEVRQNANLPLISPITNKLLKNDKLVANSELKKKLKKFLASSSTFESKDIQFTLSSELYDYLDKLADLDLFMKLNLRPPQIIVLGNESHGKSSLLERIVGFPIFPRDKHICTRCVVRVQLRRTDAKIPLAEIFINQVRMNGNERYVNEISPAGLQRQQIPMDKIRDFVKEYMDLLLQEQPQKQILDDREIVVKIQLPFALNLDLVDLPGLMTTTPKGVNQDLPEITRVIATNIINTEKAFSFFILVNDIRVPPNQSRGCEIIQKANVQDKTLGIFTKIDILATEDGDETYELETALNASSPSSFYVSYGWMGASSKSISTRESEGLLALQILYKIEEQENKMINSKFEEIVCPEKLGITNIRQQVQSLYDRFAMEQWIPHVIKYLQDNAVPIMNDLCSLGIPFANVKEYKVPLDKAVEYFKKINSQSPPPAVTHQLSDEFALITNDFFKKFISDRYEIISAKKKEIWASFRQLDSYWTIHNSFATTLQLYQNRPSSHLDMNRGWCPTNLEVYQDAKQFIQEKIKLLKDTLENMFEQLINSFISFSDLLYQEIMNDSKYSCKWPVKLERFTEASGLVAKTFKREFTLAKGLLKHWYEKNILLIFELKFESDPFHFISLQYSSNSIVWRWDNPESIMNFPNLMLLQYYQLMGKAFDNIIKEIQPLKFNLHEDSEKEKRLDMLSRVQLYIEIANKLETMKSLRNI